MVPAVTFLSRCPKPHLPPITVSSPYLCLCLMGSPCFGSIADVVQSHGGVFMDSSYPSSPVTGPLSRGQRRASEVSIASQVSGMADSYTATNIANSKCSQYQPVSVSLFLTLTQTLVRVIFPLSLFSVQLFSIFLSSFPTLFPHLLSPSTQLLWLYTHPALQLEQSSQPGRPHSFCCSCLDRLNPCIFVRLMQGGLSISCWDSNSQTESWERASLVALSPVCLTLIHCLNVNAMIECCIYLMLQCMTPTSLSHFCIVHSLLQCLLK